MNRFLVFSVERVPAPAISTSLSNLCNTAIPFKISAVDAVKNLIQWRTAAELHLTLAPDHWLAVADGIHQSHCNIKRLYLYLTQTSSSKATEAIKVIASAIRLDRNLERLELQMRNEITDEAGVELAEALTVNKILRNIT
jgi:hypothetical protein